MTNFGVRTSQPLSRSAARGGVWAVVAEASQRLAQTFVFFALAKEISPHEFGLVAVAFLTIQIVSSLTYAGWAPTVQALGPDRVRDATAATLCIFGGLLGASAMAVLAAPICTVLRSHGAELYIRLIAASLPLTQFSDLSVGFLERDLRFRVTAFAQIAGAVASAGAALYVLAVGGGGIALVVQVLVQQGVRTAILVNARRSVLRLGWSAGAAAEIWRVGGHLMAATFFGTVFTNADNASVSSLRGSTQLGGYGFVYNLCTLPYWLLGATSSRVLLPVYRRVRDSGGNVALVYHDAVEFVLALGALAQGLLLVAGPRAVDLLFASKWHAYGTTLRILAIFGFVRILAVSMAPLLVLTGRTRVQQRVQIAQVVVMLPLVVALTILAGTVGTAVAVLIPVLLGTAYLLFVVRAAVGIRFSRVLTDTAVTATCGGLGGIAALLAMRAAHGPLGALASCSLAPLAWAAAVAVARPRLARAGLSQLRAAE